MANLGPRSSARPLHRRRLALIAALTTVLTGTTGPALAAGSGTASTPTASPVSTQPALTPLPADQAGPTQLALAQAKSANKPVTIDALTTETSLTVANPDGTFTTTQNVLPTRVKQNGSWTDVDATLAHNGDGTFSPKATASGVALSGGGTAPLATFTDPAGRQLALTLPFALPAPSIQGDTATYTGVLPDVDLQATVTDQGAFHEVLVVKNAQAAADPQLKTLRLAINSNGLNTSTDADGNVTVKAADGTAAFSAPAPVMWDSATTATPAATVATASHANALASETAPSTTPGAAPVSPADPPSAVDPAGNPVSTKDGPGQDSHIAKIAVQADNSSLTLAPDTSQLNGGSPVYPLYIDPAVAPTGTTNHYAEIKEGCPDQALYDNAQEHGEGIGYQHYPGGCDGLYRSFYEINTSALTGNMQIQNSKLYLTETSGADQDTTGKDTWGVGLNYTIGINGGTTWTHQPPAIASLGQQYILPANSTNGYQQAIFDVTGTVSQNLGAGNLTFGIYGNENKYPGNYGFMRFSTNPYLVTTYEIPPNMPDSVSINQNGAVCNGGNPGWLGATTPYSNVSNVQLSARLTTNMPGVNLWGGSRLLDNTTNDGSGNPFTAGWPASPGSVSSGGTVQIPVPVALSDGHQYSWQVWATDQSRNGPPATPCVFNVDTTPPSIAVFTPSSAFPPLGSGRTPTAHAGDPNISIQVSSTDPTPGGCTRNACVKSGVAEFLWSLDSNVPTVGAHTINVVPDGNGTATANIPINLPTNQWGTHTLYVEAVDGAGNTQATVAQYSFYAPWNPNAKVATGDVTDDGTPDLVTPSSNGNLIVIPGNSDGYSQQIIASTPSTSPDGHGWDSFLVAHGGSLTQSGMDDLFAYSKNSKQLYTYRNDSTATPPGTPGHFSLTQNISTPLAKPNCAPVQQSTCTAYASTWPSSSLQQMISPGTLSTAALQAAAGTGTNIPQAPDLLTVENGKLWYYTSGANASTYLNSAYPIGAAGDWSNTTLIGVGRVGATPSTISVPANNSTPAHSYTDEITGTPTLWVRNNTTGAINSYPLTFDSTGKPTSQLTPPGQAALQAVVGANNTALCLDDANGATNDGAMVRMYVCNNSASQALTYGTDQTLHVLGKCLDVNQSGITNGTKVQLHDCNNTSAQQWAEGSNGSLVSQVSPQAQMCLDDPNGNTDGTAQLQIYTCNGSNSQNWAAGTTLPTPQTVLNIGLNSTTFPQVITPGDVNGDGNPDLYAVNNLQQVYEYPGTTPNGTLPQLGNPVALGLLGADVNATLTGGSIMRPGDTAYSAHTRLVMQPDGNLVLYSLKTSQALWSSGTYNNPGAWATMQTDGNLVVYKPLTDGNGNPTYPTPGSAANALWSTNTLNNAGAKAIVQDDCNFVVYNSAGTYIWKSDTYNPNP